MKRFGYVQRDITVSDLTDSSGRNIFCKQSAAEYSLHHFLLHPGNAIIYEIVATRMNFRSFISYVHKK